MYLPPDQWRLYKDISIHDSTRPLESWLPSSRLLASLVDKEDVPSARSPAIPHPQARFEPSGSGLTSLALTAETA
jgi:hypothetical protein